MSSRVWLITGTSSGFGRRLVTIALGRGDRVIATAKSYNKVEELYQKCDPKLRDNLRIMQLDVTEGEAVLKIKLDEAAAMWGQLDVLVNNAGISFPSILEEGGSALLRKQYETNVFGVMDMTVAALPHLRASKEPSLIVVGSRSAWRAEIPGTGPYSSSKAAVHALTETLSVELAAFNIRVLLVVPGSFHTEGIFGPEYNTENRIPANDALREHSLKLFSLVRSSIPKGDPDKAMEVLVDVVRGEGAAKDKAWPGYLILGEDAVRDVSAKCHKVLGILEDWNDVSCSVSFD